MSRIYFHSEERDAKVSGPERYLAGGICNALMLAAIGPLSDSLAEPNWLRRYLPKDCFSLRETGPAFEQSVKLWLKTSGDAGLVIEGQQVSVFSMALNTACVMGSETVKFLARLHGQCELHAYVEGKNREWLAGIIERGREKKILRANMGWEDVIELLRSDNASPVVTSFSVSDSFPDMALARGAGTWVPQKSGDEVYDEWDEWDELPNSDKWQLCMAALRGSRGNLELKPDGWGEYYFDYGVTAFDLLPVI